MTLADTEDTSWLSSFSHAGMYPNGYVIQSGIHDSSHVLGYSYIRSKVPNKTLFTPRMRQTGCTQSRYRKFHKKDLILILHHQVTIVIIHYHPINHQANPCMHAKPSLHLIPYHIINQSHQSNAKNHQPPSHLILGLRFLPRHLAIPVILMPSTAVQQQILGSIDTLHDRRSARLLLRSPSLVGVCS